MDFGWLIFQGSGSFYWKNPIQFQHSYTIVYVLARLFLLF